MINRTFIVQFTVIALVGISIPFSLVMARFLPERFLLDGEFIKQIIDNPSLELQNSSFHIIANIYRFAGLGDAPPIAALVAVILVAVAIFSAVKFEDLGRLGFVGLTTLGLTLVFGVVYMSQYTKEILTLILAIVVLRAGRSRVWEVFIVLVCLGYGLAVRPYWLLTAAMFVGFLFLLRRTKNLILMFAAVLIVYLALEPIFQAVLGAGLEGQRVWVNDGRSGADVGSLIVSPIPEATGPLAAVSAGLMLLGLLVPAALFLSGSPYLVFSAALVSFLWIVVLHAVVKGRVRDDGTGEGRRRLRAAAMLFALVTVQALFEPDYGSYIKHLTPLLPLMLTLVPLFPPVRDIRPQHPRFVEVTSR